MVELRIERENRIARLYFIQGICVEKRDRIWIADVLLKEVRLSYCINNHSLGSA